VAQAELLAGAAPALELAGVALPSAELVCLSALACLSPRYGAQEMLSQMQLRSDWQIQYQ